MAQTAGKRKCIGEFSELVITCGIFLLWLLTGWISKHAAAHFAWRLANQRLVCPRHTLLKAVARAKTGPNSDTTLTTWTTWTISIHSLLRSHSRNSFCSAFLRSRRSLAWRSEAEQLELSDWERKTQNVSSVFISNILQVPFNMRAVYMCFKNRQSKKTRIVFSRIFWRSPALRSASCWPPPRSSPSRHSPWRLRSSWLQAAR